MIPITIACVWVKAQVPYGPEYVTRLAAMVAKWTSVPYRFVCLTDRPWLLTTVQTMPIASPGGRKGWWSKLELFRPERFTGRVLYLDLDSLVVGPLDDVLGLDSSFALCPPGGRFTGRHDGLMTVRRYNSSVMVWDAPGRAPERLWACYDPDVPDRLWGDQDYIGETCPNLDLLPAAWVPRLSELDGEPGPDARVVLAKTPKNADAAKVFPWVAAAWGVT